MKASKIVRHDKNMANLRALLLHCTDTNNPRVELDCICIDGNKLVATDTRQIVILEFANKFTEEDETKKSSPVDSPIMVCPRHINLSDWVIPSNLPSILDANKQLLFWFGDKIVKTMSNSLRMSVLS